LMADIFWCDHDTAANKKSCP